MRAGRGLGLGVAALALQLFAATGAIAGGDLQEPPVLASRNGVLDLLLVTRAAPITTLAPFAPTGWVYDLCLRPRDGSDACPPNAADLYGGTRLQLEAGDVLKVRLVNRLPPITDSDHAAEPGHAYLGLNPTNIHTHGMLVSPHFPTLAQPNYGDNVFVMTLNPANGPLPPDSHIHGDVRIGHTDYEIKIPVGHPSGLFWLHPHVHGIALNQVTAGMAGIITIGDISDYVCDDSSCARRLDHVPTRHIILKDTQILADSTLQDQEDPDFCAPDALPGAAGRQGGCPGVDHSAEGGGDFANGRWFFTLNGQPYPTIPVATSRGEIWRITTTSGSVSYDLRLWNRQQQRDMLVQVLSVDGVAVEPSDDLSDQDLVQMGGAKMVPTACPGAPDRRFGFGKPLCTRRLVLMPSSRVELWVSYRDARDRVATPPHGSAAILRTAGLQTGPDGDSWPAVDLANVEFHGSGGPAPVAQVLGIGGNASAARRLSALSARLASANASVGRDPTCRALPQGHHRRIFFNAPADDPDAFGLGYEEVDPRGRPVPGTFLDVTPFDPDKATICLPLGRGNTPVHERWELINLAGEDHNFHIHQTKFRVLTKDEIEAAVLPETTRDGAILHDNIPLQHADGTCVTVDDWRKGTCTAHPIVVDIPFAIAGDFVYHCHILEHEDGGMMARIRVRPSL